MSVVDIVTAKFRLTVGIERFDAETAEIDAKILENERALVDAYCRGFTGATKRRASDICELRARKTHIQYLRGLLERAQAQLDGGNVE